MTGLDFLLYAAVIWGWSTSWYAIKHQVGVAAPEVSVFWRFLVTAPLMFLLAYWRGESARFPLKLHIALFLSGILMFSTNFILFYVAGRYLTSGLLAVIFSLASLINFTLGIVVFGEPLRWKLAVGGLLGVLGVAALFQPQVASVSGGDTVLFGCAAGAIATCCFSLGNQVSAWLQRQGSRVLPASAWGMVYGTVWSGLLALINGRSFAVPLTPLYLGSMVFLVLSATILAFYAYLSLIGRIGAARASYATVIFPVFALLISTVLEGYQWTPLAIGGLVLALSGNLLVLRRDSV